VIEEAEAEAEATAYPFPVSAPPVPTDFRKTARLLLGEKNAVNPRVVLPVLRSLSFRADVDGDGCGAIDAVTRRRYEIVLMDGPEPVTAGLVATWTMVT
jgi:CheY-like chemotaxis protein